MVHAHSHVFRLLNCESDDQVWNGTEDQHDPCANGAQLGFTHVPPAQRADWVHRPNIAVETDKSQEVDAAIHIYVERDPLELAEDAFEV